MGGDHEEREASVISMELCVPETGGIQRESVVIRHEDFVEIDGKEDMTEMELKDKKVTNLLIVYFQLFFRYIICFARIPSLLKSSTRNS